MQGKTLQPLIHKKFSLQNPKGRGLGIKPPFVKIELGFIIDPGNVLILIYLYFAFCKVKKNETCKKNFKILLEKENLLKEQKNTIDIALLPSGIYFIQVHLASGQTTVSRLIKE